MRVTLLYNFPRFLYLTGLDGLNEESGALILGILGSEEEEDIFCTINTIRNKVFQIQLL